MAPLTIKPVTKAGWPDFEALFEGKGGPSYCWCMAWRPMAKRTEANNADRKAALKSFVDRRVPIGLVGYVGGEPVAWCSVAPRTSFISFSKQQDESEADVWSISCFFIRRDHRKQGLSAEMLEGAIDYVRKRGGKVLESYPVDPDSPSYRFMGFVALFTDHGFVETGRAGSRRHVMKLAL